jgi:hypothetical protein
MRDVGFAYPGAGPVLRDVGLAVDEGRTLGIVGPTGAGKSTMIALVRRDGWSAPHLCGTCGGPGRRPPPGPGVAAVERSGRPGSVRPPRRGCSRRCPAKRGVDLYRLPKASPIPVRPSLACSDCPTVSLIRASSAGEKLRCGLSGLR